MKKYLQNKKIAGCIVVAILVSFGLITWFIGMPIIQMASDPASFRLWMSEQGLFGYIAMICMIFLQIVIAFIPGEPLEIAAGYAFGFWQGTFLCLFASMIASGFVMWLVKTYGTSLVYVFFSKEKMDSIHFLKEENKLKLWTFIAFFIPGSPKDIMTYMVGLTSMKVTTFMLLSTIARIPSVVTSTFSGNALGDENYIVAIASFIITMLVSGIGLWVYSQFVNKKSEAKTVLKKLETIH